MKKLRTIAVPAKLNLRLRILARETSGYHQIETLFGAVEWGDRLLVSWDPDGDGVGLEVVGEDVGPEKENLAHRAARAFLRTTHLEGRVEMLLEKRIPAGGGLGGGSADAGMVLRTLNELVEAPLAPGRLGDVAAGLGSDVPFFVSPAPFALAWGRGDRLLPLPAPPAAPVLLALPPVRVETARAYGLLRSRVGEGSGRPGAVLLDREALSDWSGLTALARNDFEGVILPRYALLRDVREGLAASGARFALLAGSGSSLYAVFDTAEAADSAERELSARFPDVRFVLTRTLERFPEAEERADVPS